SAAPPRPPSNTVSPYSSSSSPPHRPPPSFPTRRSSDLFWDRLCTSSVWHGVTTALMGNCGLTLAPLRPEHREPMLATFCCVEDRSEEHTSELQLRFDLVCRLLVGKKSCPLSLT